MRIAFMLIGNSRRSGYLDGQTLRYGGVAGSGTDTSAILVAEQLAAAGHEVVITSDKLEPELEAQYALAGKLANHGRIVNGVQYSDHLFTNVENKNFDVLVTALWFEYYNNIPITVSKAVIYWCHMQWIYGIDQLVNYVRANNLALGFVHISEWEKSQTINDINMIQLQVPAQTTLIPNPVADDIITQVKNENIARKPHSFIFHAAWARGGAVAYDVVKQLPYPDKELHVFDYLMANDQHPDSFFFSHMATDKLTLYRQLAAAEYFAYPLYTPYQDVHKDTFSCVVADAVALGCTPVTYPLGAVPDNFGQFCQWVQFPDGVNPAAMQLEPLSKDVPGVFKSEQAVNNFVAAVGYLEQNPALKDKVKSEGAQFIVSNFSAPKVGQMWIDFVAQLTGVAN